MSPYHPSHDSFPRGVWFRRSSCWRLRRWTTHSSSNVTASCRCSSTPTSKTAVAPREAFYALPRASLPYERSCRSLGVSFSRATLLRTPITRTSPLTCDLANRAGPTPCQLRHTLLCARRRYSCVRAAELCLYRAHTAGPSCGLPPASRARQGSRGRRVAVFVRLQGRSSPPARFTLHRT